MTTSAGTGLTEPLSDEKADPLSTGYADAFAPGAPAAAQRSYSRTQDPRQLWRRTRLPLVLVVLLVVTAIVVTAYRQRTRLGAFDPESVQPQGSRALATLLSNSGSDVRRASGSVEQLSGIVFFPFASELSRDQLRPLMTPPSGVHVVLVGPHGAFDVLGAQVNGSRGEESSLREPGCEFAPATAAGASHVGGEHFQVGESEDATIHTCYAVAGSPTLVHIARDDSSVTLLGSGDIFTNDRLDDEGNAALALGLLDRGQPVTWVMRGRAGAASGDEAKSLSDLLPDGVQLAMLQLLLAGFVAMLWRGRRLGPVVTEPLPVIVRAAEAVEGRGRLYAAANARDRAGWNLRRAARGRLISRLGRSRDDTAESLVAGVAARTQRRSDEVGRLLYGPDPVDDAALVRLAAGLDDLDSEVRRS